MGCSSWNFRMGTRILPLPSKLERSTIIPLWQINRNISTISLPPALCLLLIRPINKAQAESLEGNRIMFSCRIQTSILSPGAPHPILPLFLFGISCEVGTLQSRQIDSAAEWEIPFIRLLELCRHLSWAPLQNLALFTLNIWPLHDTLQHAKRMCWGK